MAVTTASGFRNYAAMTHPIFAKKLIQRFTAASVTGNITHSDIIPSELKTCGNQVVFTLPPEARIFKYTSAQDLQRDQLNIKRITMTVNRALYWNLELDPLEKKQVCDIDMWVNEYKDRAAKVLALRIDRELLTEIPGRSDPFNKGRCAGKVTGQYDMGETGAPIVISKDNIINKLIHASQILDEANIPAGDRFIVFPSVAKAAFLTNPILMQAYQSGLDKTVVIDGAIPNMMGFDIYFSNNMPVFSDVNLATYASPFGSKKAVGFVTQIAEQQKVGPDTNSFSEFIRYLNLYDFMVLNPELLGTLYASYQIN